VGYTTADGGKHHLEAFVHRAGLYPVDGPNMQQLVTDSDDASFGQILGKQHHMLRELLPNTTNHQYGFCNRRHNYTLNTRTATGYFLKTCINYCFIHVIAAVTFLFFTTAQVAFC